MAAKSARDLNCTKNISLTTLMFRSVNGARLLVGNSGAVGMYKDKVNQE